MSIGTAANPTKVVLDTNIIISAVGFGGKSRKVLQLILDKKIQATTSPVLLAELEDVVTKKFPNLKNHFERINKQIRKKFKVVRPQRSAKIVKDEADNRVLECALEAHVDFIISGDKHLLNLRYFRDIKIISPAEFLKELLKMSQ